MLAFSKSLSARQFLAFPKKLPREKGTVRARAEARAFCDPESRAL
jgi:hypothetical protein